MEYTKDSRELGRKVSPAISTHPMKSEPPHGVGPDFPGPQKRVRVRRRQRLRCGAKTRAGTPCKRWATNGRNRCRKHGANSKRGPESGTWKNGFYSQILPTDVGMLACRAKHDPGLRDMKEGIAIADVRIRALCGSLGHGGIGNWDTAASALTRLEGAGTDLIAARKALDDLRGAVRNGRTVDLAWKEIRELLQERDRLLTGDVNRHKVTADMISADRVAAFMVGMIDALREESRDRDLIRRVLARWERLMGLAGVTTPPEPVITRIP